MCSRPRQTRVIRPRGDIGWPGLLRFGEGRPTARLDGRNVPGLRPQAIIFDYMFNVSVSAPSRRLLGVEEIGPGSPRVDRSPVLDGRPCPTPGTPANITFLGMEPGDLAGETTLTYTNQL